MPRLLFLLSFSNLVIGTGAFVVGGVIAPMAASLEVSVPAAGQAIALIGTNGSGKSTTLKLIAGVIEPTSGKVTVNGKISPLIELGAGFHPELSGRDNIYLNGTILGLTKKQIDQRFDEIVAFSELKKVFSPSPN